MKSSFRTSLKGSMKGSTRGGRIFSEEHSVRGQKFDRLKNTSDPQYDDDYQTSPPHYDKEPLMSPTPTHNHSSSPLNKSPWSHHFAPHYPEEGNNNNNNDDDTENVLMGSLVREEGHIYSLAAYGDSLYTGSDSKNIRVWKNQKEFSSFKSNSGLVKAIVISRDHNIFTGHQDGKIRVWKVSARNTSNHKRIGTLPTLKAFIKSSMKTSNYSETKRKRKGVCIKHFDAISCLSLNEDQTFLYSASWDKTIKVWRIYDSKCLESLNAHEDAVNSVVAGFNGLVFTGSADGTVKVWRRELQGKGTKHFFSQTLLKQECAVTALAINPESTVLYCGSSDGLVNYWERERSMSHGGVLRGHKLAVLCLAAAGKLLFSGSADMTICVWQRMGESDGEHLCLSVLNGHTGPVKCLAVEEYCESVAAGRMVGDGEDGGGGDGGGGDLRQWILYSGSLDKSVKMWKVFEKATAVLPPDEEEFVGSLASNMSFSSHGRTSLSSQNRRLY